MRPIILTLLLLFSGVLCLPDLSGAFDHALKHQFHPALSLQGFTGLLNTPNAHVTEEGNFYGLYSNQKESKWRDRLSFQDNYLFSIGFFSIAEIGGRLTEAPGVGARDLSGNFKVTTQPLTRRYPFIPVLGAGAQDLGGGAKNLQTKYMVLSEDLWRLRLSAGYGSGPDRMKGLFGGAEIKLHDWVYLLGEYDTKETNVGARVVTPHIWKIPVSFTATAKSSLNNNPGNIDIAFGFSFPLDFRLGHRDAKPEGHGAAADIENIEAGSSAPQAKAGVLLQNQLPQVRPDARPAGRPSKLTALRDRLIRAGFQNIRAGEKDGTVVVIEYENVVFNHNEMDALGVVAGIAVEMAPENCRHLRLIIKKKNISVMQVSMPVVAVSDYLKTGRGLADLKAELTVKNAITRDDDVEYLDGDVNSSFLTTSLMLWPGLDTKVGTDYAAFDYSLSLKPELSVNLWSGAQVHARWDVPFSRSDNMDGRYPYYYNPTPARLERLMLFQGVKLAPGLLANIGGGQILPDIKGTINEISWQPGNGRHLLNLSQSWGRNDRTKTNQETYLASYRFYFSPLDLSLQATAGRFWAQDTGYHLELRRFFGDTAVSFYYKNTRIKESMSQGLPLHWEAVGIQFAFPLTPQRDMKHYYKMQLRGTEQWGYAQETVLAGSNSDNANYLPPVPLALIPLPSTALYRSYLNRDRLSAEYISSHVERMREAWMKYKDDL